MRIDLKALLQAGYDLAIQVLLTIAILSCSVLLLPILVVATVAQITVFAVIMVNDIWRSKSEQE